MKVDLIYAMRHDGAGMFGGFSEERKEDAVIAVMESSRNKDEFWKITKSLEFPPTDTNRIKIKVEDLLDFGQNTRFNNLKTIKFK